MAATVGAGMLAGCSNRTPFAEEADSSPSGEPFAYTVTAHGIEGDGETEVGGAVQDLLDTVASEGGGVIYFPPGRYLFEQTPLVGSDTTLLGAGRSTVFEGVRPAGDEGRALLTNRGYDERGYGGASNWSVRNIRIDSPSSNGIMPAHAENVRLENIYGDAILYHHIDIVSSRNVTVDGYWASRGGEADSDAPLQFDAQKEGISANRVWDGTNDTLVEDDGTPTKRCTVRDFEINAENGPSHGVHIHRGEHELLTITDGIITGCQYTGIRSDPGESIQGMTVNNVSCLENARGITLGHIKSGREELTINNATIQTESAELAAGSGLYGAGFNGANISNVTVEGAFTNSIIFDDMENLRMNNITATGGVDQAFRFRDNVAVTLITSQATDCGGAGIYVGPESTLTYGGVQFDNVGSKIVVDGEIAEWDVSAKASLSRNFNRAGQP
ncbi:glycosyl hydrolase family 28-related protein [Natranaeroarchaeum aerophilus]|uniref:Glycoside hydrolase family 55 protein n=1 Tax=Natranaeroarchaeum aerophilus TaxID=2917711 RepID=A0AAE3K5Z5_9EURY|nr:glycosyl hydrolase family 28-related protein [Natranaeroarchaeum aerophilus]MCL9814468.1 glycoside hydrolase family 55 protein [Natranaeroarchaeum aerophilus]